VPPGAIVDVGARDGEMSCFYTSLDASRTVHAFEPSRRFFSILKARYVNDLHPNLVASNLGLGSSNRLVKVESGLSPEQRLASQRHGIDSEPQVDVSTRDPPLDIRRMDSLFVESGGLFEGERVGFWHLDVEWSEALALRGAHATLLRDAPLLAVELHVHQNRTYTHELMALLTEEALGYKVYLIDEICGARLDCRNLLCVPDAMHATLATGASHIFDFANATGTVMRARDAAALFDMTPASWAQLEGSCTLSHHGGKTNPHWREGKLG